MAISRARTAIVRPVAISDMEFIYRAGISARNRIAEALAADSRLHSIKVIEQPNAFRIQIVAAGPNGPCSAEACVEAEDGMYRLSVRSPESFRVAENGDNNIFHETCREDLTEVAQWLSEQVKESLT